MFRDRKTMITLLLFPLLIPLMILMYSFIYEEQLEGEIYEVGVDYELNTNEKSYMEEANLKGIYYDNLKLMKEAYDKGEIFGYIDYDSDNKKYTIYTNEESEDGMYVSSGAKAYLEGYNQYLGNLTLIGEDIDIDKVYDNIHYEVISLEGENFMLSLIFTISFTYIVMSIVMSTTNMATNATAVEKENGTLETLLTFPILSRDLVIGKYLATVVMGIVSSMIGLILTVVSLWIAMNFFSVFEGISFSIGLGTFMIAVLILILASLFVGGLAIAVTSFAKSYKEAQSVSSALNMITLIPMMISLFQVNFSSIYYVVPILNYTQILMDIFSFDVNIFHIMLVVVSSFIYVVLVVGYIIHQYKTERVLFGIVSS